MTNGMGMTNGWGPLTGGNLNMWSAVNSFVGGNVLAPRYMDLSQGRAYAFMISNMSDNDLTSGTITLEGADHADDDFCAPGDFEPLEPVAGCDPIVSGVPAMPPVRIELSNERPIRAHSVCQFAAPCPKQFFRVTVTGIATTDIDVIGFVTDLVRTDFSHVGPLGFIPQPLAQPFQLGWAGHQQMLAGPYSAPAHQAQPAAQAQQPAPPPQPAPDAGSRRSRAR